VAAVTGDLSDVLIGGVTAMVAAVRRTLIHAAATSHMFTLSIICHEITSLY